VGKKTKVEKKDDGLSLIERKEWEGVNECAGGEVVKV